MQVIEFKFPELDIEPTASEQIVEAGPDRLKVESAGIVRGWQYIEGNVLRERAGGMEIEASPIEPVSSNLSLSLRWRDCRWVGIDRDAIGAFTMPDGRDAEGKRPIRSILEDGSVALIHHLVAVVFEVLAKWTELGPGFMTGGARHAVLASERRQSGRGATVSKHQGGEKEAEPDMTARVSFSRRSDVYRHTATSAWDWDSMEYL